MGQKITIEPVTRVEGHGKVTIHLDDENKVIQTEDYYLVKFLLYANRTKPNSVSKPIISDEVKTVVKKYEKLLDSIIKDVIENIKVVLPNSDPLKLSNQIFYLIDLKRF